MRTLILSSLSILSGLTTTVQAQPWGWVPYSFYSFKQTQQKEENKSPNQKNTVETPVVANSTPSDVKTEEAIEQKTEEMIVDITEPNAFSIIDSDIATSYQSDSNSIFYADPDLSYSREKNEKPSKQTQQKKNSRFCTDNLWVEADYLLAWMKRGDIDAPLITTGSPDDAVPGAIGEPGTNVVFGDKHYDFHRTTGVKAAIGGVFGTNRQLAFDIDAFWIFKREKHFHIDSDASGSPLIARPFFDVQTGAENAEEVSNPGFFSGTSKALVKTQFWGAELNLGERSCNEGGLDFFIGFRYLRLQEKIRVRDDMVPFTTPSGLTFNGSANAVESPDTLTDEDTFRTNNNFFGGQLGAKARISPNPWISFDIFGKVAVGSTEEKYKSEGSTTWESTAFGDQFATGGVLVQPNNSVHTKKWKFTWVPEIGADIVISPVDRFRFLVGYSFLWWSNVVRPGDQIDRNVNSGQIPRDVAYYTPAIQAPNDHLDQEAFWMQSVNFGIQFDF